MKNKPFIIKSKIVEPMLPKDSDYYDESQETRIQILQAMNGYLAVFKFLYRLICSTRVSSFYGLFGITKLNAPISLIFRLGLWG